MENISVATTSKRYKVLVLDEEYRPVLEGFTHNIELDCQQEYNYGPVWDDNYNAHPEVFPENLEYTMTVKFCRPKFKETLIELTHHYS